MNADHPPSTKVFVFTFSINQSFAFNVVLDRIWYYCWNFLPGQKFELHILLAISFTDPVQLNPLCFGRGLSHFLVLDRFWFPPPHVTGHVLHSLYELNSDQPPWTVSLTGYMNVSNMRLVEITICEREICFWHAHFWSKVSLRWLLYFVNIVIKWYFVFATCVSILMSKLKITKSVNSYKEYKTENRINVYPLTHHR